MTPVSEFHQLDALLGEWRWEASIAGLPTAQGEASFEWLERDGFLVQRVDGEPAPAAPPEWIDFDITYTRVTFTNGD